MKGRNLSKAMKRLKQCGSVQRMVDANGDLTVEAAEVIRKLFPRNPPQEPQQWNGLDERPAVTAHVFAVDDVREAVAATKNLSSTGLGAWSYELVRMLVMGRFVASLEDPIAELLNNINNGRAGSPKQWVKSLLTFIPKPDGAVRGICADNVWLRLAGKASWLSQQQEVMEKLQPFQFAVGMKGGSQALAHTVAVWEQNIRNGVNSDNIIVKLDIVKAFPSVLRSEMRDALAELAPQFLSSFDWEYGVPTELFLGDGTFAGTCERGIRTGDVRGPLYFSFALH